MQALQDVSLDVQRGEVLAVVGENGAGKSTLMNVLYGMYTPDEGVVLVDDKPVTFRSPREAMCAGVGMVHQHFMLSASLTVAESVILGAEPTRFGFLDLPRACREVEASAAAHGFALDVHARVGDLSVGSQQKVEILKVLHRGAKVIILDEPTAVLTPQESDELLAAIRALKDQGRAVVLISHKLREVLEVADRIAVMRRGRKVLETPSANVTRELLAEAMLGEGRAAGQLTIEPSIRGEPALTVKEATLEERGGRKAVSGLSLELRTGEIVGVAGVDGNGQRELVAGIVGTRTFTAGTVVLRGQDVTRATVGARRKLGLVHIPEDRLRDAVVGPMSAEENLSLGRTRQPPFARGPWIDFEGRRQRYATLAESYDVRPRDPTLPLSALSGGNQQKLVVARELDAQPAVIIAVQPTRGLDFGAVAEVHRQLAAARTGGAAVLLVSLDLEELLALCDRIVVLFRGELVGEQRRGRFDERQLGRWMLGARDA